MGLLTRAEIVAQGQLEAGMAGKTTRLLEALVLWEQSQYKAWAFGFLRKRRTGLALSTGTQSLLVGSGEGGITSMIKRILNPIWITDSNYGTRAQANIIDLDDQSEESNEDGFNPTQARGIPTGFKIRHALSTIAPFRACKKLIPIAVPNKSYLLSFDYIETPVVLQTDSTGIPLYPNDQTMKKFVEMQAVKWANGAADEDYQALRDELASMVMDDRIKDGQDEGNNRTVKMDPDIYR